MEFWLNIYNFYKFEIWSNTSFIFFIFYFYLHSLSLEIKEVHNKISNL